MTRLGEYSYWPKDRGPADVVECSACDEPIVLPDDAGMRPGDGPLVCRTCAAEEWSKYRAERDAVNVVGHAA